MRQYVRTEMEGPAWDDEDDISEAEAARLLCLEFGHRWKAMWPADPRFQRCESCGAVEVRHDTREK